MAAFWVIMCMWWWRTRRRDCTCFCRPRKDVPDNDESHHTTKSDGLLLWLWIGAPGKRFLPRHAKYNNRSCHVCHTRGIQVRNKSSLSKVWPRCTEWNNNKKESLIRSEYLGRTMYDAYSPFCQWNNNFKIKNTTTRIILVDKPFFYKVNQRCDFHTFLCANC